MTNNCPDNTCAKKREAIDTAIGFDGTNWSVILEKTSDIKDVELALRFCEIFKLEAKVKVSSDGYEVLANDDLVRII